MDTRTVDPEKVKATHAKALEAHSVILAHLGMPRVTPGMNPDEIMDRAVTIFARMKEMSTEDLALGVAMCDLVAGHLKEFSQILADVLEARGVRVKGSLNLQEQQ